MRGNKLFPPTAGIIAVVAALTPLFAEVSQTPPMGFNSYDCMSFSATEKEMKAIADTMAKKYLPYGWEYVCIDWCWSYPGMSGNHPNQSWINNVDGNPTPETRLTMDGYGRLMPDTIRHPSSKGGQGFKPLADYIHGKGLKFGIHIMRGIPRQAVYANTSIYGTSYCAADAADKNENCAWLNQMYGLTMSNPAAQAYLHSILNMYAAWGIDYIKIDDLMNSNVSPRTSFKSQIQAYRKANDSTHRDIVFSTSPGATPVGDSVFVRTYANQWRMADDLWDNWNTLNTMIDLFAKWHLNAYAPHFPDADMIPIGRLSKRGPVGNTRWSNLTRAEQYTLMTMWCIGRSPLIWGGDVRDNRPAEDSLMTNAEVIEVNQRGERPMPVVTSSQYPVWASDRPDSSNIKYVAMINRTSNTATVTLSLDKIGLDECEARDLWAKKDLGSFSGTFGRSIVGHGSGLYKLTSLTTAVEKTGARASFAGGGGRFTARFSPVTKHLSIRPPSEGVVMVINLAGRPVARRAVREGVTIRVSFPAGIYIVGFTGRLGAMERTVAAF
ncbi:MAG: glycoside hydrolase family 27 protein [Chitinispirillaceae bacterium]|nr:glycoside hydrolase family 27 protein [Chitinispirillaceae bacterium]